MCANLTPEKAFGVWRWRLTFSIDLPSDVFLGCQHSMPDTSIRFYGRQNKLCLVLQVRDYHLCNTNHKSSLWEGLLSISSTDQQAKRAIRARLIPFVLEMFGIQLTYAQSSAIAFVSRVESTSRWDVMTKLVSNLWSVCDWPLLAQEINFFRPIRLLNWDYVITKNFL